MRPWRWSRSIRSSNRRASRKVGTGAEVVGRDLRLEVGSTWPSASRIERYRSGESGSVAASGAPGLGVLDHSPIRTAARSTRAARRVGSTIVTGWSGTAGAASACSSLSERCSLASSGTRALVHADHIGAPNVLLTAPSCCGAGGPRSSRPPAGRPSWRPCPSALARFRALQLRGSGTGTTSASPENVWLSALGSAWAFATIWPGLFETAALLGVRARPPAPARPPGPNSSAPPSWQGLVFVVVRRCCRRPRAVDLRLRLARLRPAPHP
jgi:hypothetical protein